MKVEWTEWILSDAERQKFDTWMAGIMHGHTGTKDVRNRQLAWTPLTKPLSECVVTLFTTGGVHLKSDQPYDIANPHGDWTYRWRRFPIQETPVYTGMSDGARHPQTEAIGEALDTLVRLAQDYKAYMEARVAEEASKASRIPGVGRALQDHVARIERLIDILDHDALDQLREIVNRVTTMELRVSGKFV
jgi:hypothetical protein